MEVPDPRSVYICSITGEPLLSDTVHIATVSASIVTFYHHTNRSNPSRIITEFSRLAAQDLHLRKIGDAGTSSQTIFQP